MKYSKFLAIALFSVFFFSCVSNQTKKTNKQIEQLPQLEMVWQTDSLMTTCESVLYHKESGLIYVANVNNAPWELDHNGFISTIDTKGNIIEHKWIEGLSGPKGMGIVGNKLYVNDINRLVEIDITEQKIINAYSVEGNPALNDITVSPEGVVYSSDSSSDVIYALQNGRMDTIVKKDFGGLNGLLHTKKGMYYISSKTSEFGICDLAEGSLKVLTKELGHGDGIVKLANGDFIVSSWKGEVFYIHAKDWSKTQLLNTVKQGINAADIDFIHESNLLLVPTFFNNRVVAYELNN